MRLAREGKLGKLQTLHCNAGTGTIWPPITSHDWLPAEPQHPKEVVDWDRWLGSLTMASIPTPTTCRAVGAVTSISTEAASSNGVPTRPTYASTPTMPMTLEPVEYEPKGANTTPYFVYCRYPNGVKLYIAIPGEMGFGTAGALRRR